MKVLNSRVVFAFVVVTLFLGRDACFGQSLSFEDLINLQRSNLEDAKGYFNYKGWRWTGTTKDCADCLKQGDYDLVYDKTVWTGGNESLQLLQHSGHPNAIIYYTSQGGFNALEGEAKNLLTATGSGTEENRIWSTYTGHGQKFTFNIRKNSNSYSSGTNYNVIIVDQHDLDTRVASMCNKCKGKGQISEHESCSYCSGDGRQNCKGCRGKGKLYCNSCKEGRVNCGTCYGKSTLQCNKCYGRGNLQCNKCYGRGEYNCNSCYGKGTVTQNVPGYSFQRNCGNCSGKGKFTCSNCSGKGNLRCENCTGIGTIPCPRSKVSAGSGQSVSACVGGTTACSRCSGNYATNCSQCNGTGNTELVCNSCNGSGQSSREIKKVCPVCNGTKKRFDPFAGAKVKSHVEIDVRKKEITEFFTVVEDMPQYPGGDAALLKFISNNLQYPVEAKLDGITGVVYVSYIVDTDGAVRDIKIVRGVDPLLDEEAKRVIGSIDGYSPGRQRGKAVPVQFTMPVRFALN